MTHQLEKTANSKRDIRFDILKTVGLLCIIFAHIGPETNIFFKIRRFDVPLMVIVSGSLYSYSASNKKISFWNYLKSRLPRLIAPVWLFLIFFFISAYIIFSIISQPYPFSEQKILDSFLLLKGIGYVWIIRVFTLVALVASLLINLYRFCKSEARYLALLAIIYIGYEFVFNFVKHYDLRYPVVSSLVNDYLFYLVSYGCLFGLGIILPKLQERSILLISGFFSIVCLICSFYYYHYSGNYISLIDFKYPPRIYYVSYGIFMSFLGYFITNKLYLKYHLSNKDNILTRSIIFVSSSTLWIYLWHIFLVYYWDNLVVKYIPKFSRQYTLAFLVVTGGAIALTYIQKRVVSGVVKKTGFGQKNAEILSILFLK
ncbi:acyltransferase [Aetokthonos hydrillicola Thurmond2011]|uniref:Acyltransferase n=1 Tax=Aetokthonos hydrillicola Thurmond2011 TaxID=2712845 RepID=A0AAP5M807_9CYAN|nr:acyltransferase [Aetokthonos hydrillicola]MBO3460950.1 acyltransferase [Aetokthonos hydrillicola CCALA 1050]MBW4583622.1 acyltransferase [Aetokthonos hydrillicola CCALA 1050]MDR9895685.1 acyltransferase [Aetokthonos hydrillicola Thurmond2011]